MPLTPHLDTYLTPEKLQGLAARVQTLVPAAQVKVENKEVTATVPASRLVDVLTSLRDDLQCLFTQLTSICGVDYLGYPTPKPGRFAVAYQLLSLPLNQRLRVKVYLESDTPSLPSVVALYPAAGWYERETYDMFGIVFEGHPDLRRLLTEDDFDGFPLRKDFPLAGHREVFYDAEQQRVAHKPVDLPQELRRFDKVSPWQGATGNAKLAEEDNTFSLKEFES